MLEGERDCGSKQAHVSVVQSLVLSGVLFVLCGLAYFSSHLLAMQISPFIGTVHVIYVTKIPSWISLNLQRVQVNRTDLAACCLST